MSFSPSSCANNTVFQSSSSTFSLLCGIVYLSPLYGQNLGATSFAQCISACNDVPSCIAVTSNYQICSLLYTSTSVSVGYDTSRWAAWRSEGPGAIEEPEGGAYATPVLVGASSSGGTAATGTPAPVHMVDQGGGGGLSTGAKAGIGVGVAIVALLILAVVFFLFWKKRKRKSPKREGHIEVDTDFVPLATIKRKDVPGRGQEQQQQQR